MRLSLLALIAIIVTVVSAPAVSANKKHNGMEFYGTSILFVSPYPKGAYIDLLLEAPNGDRRGFLKKNYTELTKACYVEEKTGDAPSTRRIACIDPAEGRYCLSVTGKDAGIYRIEAAISAGSGFSHASLTGIAGKGDVQRVKLTYTGSGCAGLEKAVDVALLKREIKVALQFSKINKTFGKGLAKDLAEIDKALSARDTAAASQRTKALLWKLKIEHEQYYLGSPAIVKAWFNDSLVKDPAIIRDILNKKNVYFSNIDNIRNEKKEDWFKAQVLETLINDTELLMKQIKKT